MKRTLLTSVWVVIVMVTLACNARGGSTLYFSSNRDGNWEIYSTVVKSGEVVNITNTAENEINPVLSPDRKWIAFLIGRDGRSIDVLSLESRDSPERFAISKGAGRFWSPVWSPDSSQIAFAAKKSGEEFAYVQITDLGSPSPARLSTVKITEVGDWSPDGDSVVFSSMGPNNSDSGGIHVRNPDGVNQSQMTCGIGDQEAVWSHDSSKLAFISERDGNKEIYVMERGAVDGACSDNKDDRPEPFRLTETDEVESDISWSPDGEKILFVSERDGNKEIYVMGERGDKQTRLTFNNIDDYDPVWSPDGQTIAFVSELASAENPDIFVMDPKGQNQTRVTTSTAMDKDPRW